MEDRRERYLNSVMKKLQVLGISFRAHFSYASVIGIAVTGNTMILTVLTALHVILSLIGIGSGFVVVLGLLVSRRLDGWTTLFLSTTVLTSVTGFSLVMARLP